MDPVDVRCGQRARERVSLREVARQPYRLPHPFVLLLLVIAMFGVTFATSATGVLPGLYQTRYGFHIVLVERRVPGRRLDFELARAGIAAYLSSRVQERALRQYLRVLAVEAEIEGADLEAAASPLLL